MNAVVPPHENGGIHSLMWEKFVKICAFSGVCAVCR